MVSFRLGNNSEFDASSMKSVPQAENKIHITNRDTRGQGKITIPLGGNANDEESKFDQSGNYSTKIKIMTTGFMCSTNNTIDDDEDFNKIVFDTGDKSVTSRKKDGSKKQKKPKRKASEENQYLNGPKRQNTCSRRRQNTPLSQFNEILVNIIDSCITFDNTRMFHQPVRKADFPTYYDVIKTPMDLSTLKAKAKRCEYRTVEQFDKDLKLLQSNSELFNGIHHFVTTQAASIMERADLLVQADMFQLKELEEKVKEDEE